VAGRILLSCVWRAGLTGSREPAQIGLQILCAPEQCHGGHHLR